MTEKRLKKLEEIKEHLKVVRNGETLYYLSPGFALKQNMSCDELDKLTALHNEMQDLFEEMEACADPRDLPAFVEKVEEIEYAMQEAWKFEKDPTKHSWWYRVPHCQCPDLDNRDNWGIARRVINKECPVHGTLLKQEKT